MKTRLTIAAITALGSFFATAETVGEQPQADPVQEAIHQFNSRDKSKPNEVTVTLDPVGAPPAPAAKEGVQPAPAAENKAQASEPVLVTGKPPEEAKLAPSPPSEPEKSADIPAEEVAPKPQQGVAVHIEKLQTGEGLVDPKQIKLLAPFPAKPLAQPPAGWRLEASENAPPFTRKVELAPGTEVTLTIRPHLLVPEADGAKVFAISEPGYEAPLGYQQAATVGAILSTSIQQLDEDSKQLGTAIDRLQQLLVSLPKPESPPEAKATLAPATTRKR